jgi:hypothetical protein
LNEEAVKAKRLQQEACMASQPEQQANTRREGRSPGYPYFSIEKALERVRQLYDQENMHWAPLSSAVGAWNYSPKSSGGRQSLATMKYYGLIDVMGDGDARRVRVSDTSRRILLDQREDDTEKRALIREVALSPSAHKALLKEYPDDLPSDGTVLHFLMFAKGFNKDAARDLLAEFKQTASYIGLYQPQKEVDKIAEEDESGRTPPKVNVGDLIQATVNGQHVFPKGAKVLGFSSDGAWVFTDKSKSAVKLEEITVLEPAQNRTVQERPTIPASLLQIDDESPPVGNRKAVFPVSEGDVSLTFPKDITADGLRELGMYLNIFLKKEEAAVDGQ